MRDYFALISAFAPYVTVEEKGDAVSVRAFIQPMSAVSTQEQGKATAAGVRDMRRYRMICPAGVSLAPGATVSWDGKRFEVLRAEKFGESHREALLRLKAGEADA